MARRFPILSRSAVRSVPAVPSWLRILGRQGVALVLAAGLLLLFRERIAAIDLAAVTTALDRIAPEGWLGALSATYLSFRALGRYDAVVHRFLRTGVAPDAAVRAGAAAIAISQVVGAGLVTGALVRWRLLARLSLGEAMRVSATVTGLFLLSWLIAACGAVLLLAPATGMLATPAARAAAGLALAFTLAGALILFLCRAPAFFGRRLGPVPGPLALLRLFALTLADTGSAGIALWFLLPAGLDLGPGEVISVYLVALGAALVLATPGGIGPFEAVLFLAFPGADPAGLMASIIAFRAIYIALPALSAMAVLIRGPQIGAAAPRPALRETWQAAAGAGAEIFAARRAECGIVRQGLHGLLMAGGATAVVGRGRLGLVALFDPFGPGRADPALLTALASEAAAEGRVPCLYKCGPRVAARARRAGWRVARIAEEQVLDPRAAAGFAAPAFAGLRRKLRRAGREGVTVAEAGAILPLAGMARVAQRWTEARGPERGFSMGRFAPDYVAGQRVFLATRDETLIAFATFHEARGEWVLDLMRWDEGAPDGTMHSLIAAAVAAAAQEGLTRLSLAALPAPSVGAGIAAGLARVPGRFRARIASLRRGPDGLRQFKAAFAPRAEPCYLAAPGRVSLALCALDIAAEIRWPGRLPAAGRADQKVRARVPAIGSV